MKSELSKQDEFWRLDRRSTPLNFLRFLRRSIGKSFWIAENNLGQPKNVIVLHARSKFSDDLRIRYHSAARS